MSGANDINEPERPRAPLCGCDPSVSQRIRRTVFADQWMRVVRQTVMWLVEEVVGEDGSLVAKAPGDVPPGRGIAILQPDVGLVERQLKAVLARYGHGRR